MWEQERTRYGEEEDVEQAQGKVDDVDKYYNCKRDVMMRESAITHNRQGQNL